jgi:hypothetical protein
MVAHLTIMPSSGPDSNTSVLKMKIAVRNETALFTGARIAV